MEAALPYTHLHVLVHPDHHVCEVVQLPGLEQSLHGCLGEQGSHVPLKPLAQVAEAEHVHQGVDVALLHCNEGERGKGEGGGRERGGEREEGRRGMQGQAEWQIDRTY